MTPDVNVLVAASRADHPHHAVSLAWLTGALAAPPATRLRLLPMVAAGFVRVVTHSRVFPTPTPPGQAVAFIRALLESHGVAMLELGPEWPTLARTCETHAVAGGAVADAWIAAAVQAHAEHLVTFDRDFRRYLKTSELTVLRP